MRINCKTLPLVSFVSYLFTLFKQKDVKIKVDAEILFNSSNFVNNLDDLRYSNLNSLFTYYHVMLRETKLFSNMMIKELVELDVVNFASPKKKRFL